MMSHNRCYTSTNFIRRTILVIPYLNRYLTFQKSQSTRRSKRSANAAANASAARRKTTAANVHLVAMTNRIKSVNSAAARSSRKRRWVICDNALSTNNGINCKKISSRCHEHLSSNTGYELIRSLKTRAFNITKNRRRFLSSEEFCFVRELTGCHKHRKHTRWKGTVLLWVERRWFDMEVIWDSNSEKICFY